MLRRWTSDVKFVSKLIVFLFLVSATTAEDLECGKTKYSDGFSRILLGSSNHRIVGGFETKVNAWPWMAEILRGRNHQCGGALIDSEFVLTAAHCFLKGENPRHYSVLLGGHEIFGGKRFRVLNITLHNLYHIRESAYDIAIMKIWPPVRMNQTINKVCLPSFGPPATHTMCVVTGWGRMEEDGPASPALREAHVPIVSSITCNDHRHYQGRIFQPTMICAGYADGKIDACQGDSGGPLVCWNKNAWELQGIVSWGIGCAEPGHPGVYTRVHALTSWVKLQMLLLK
ncbi:unnamed protein product [Bursaphelenchus xylophilus]|uniref:(pine wood nematode) hypothetical protein n=1 Tax=Bursaphelenchus xylophilus TaxID=6326 RepID=A0A1I7S7S4_BURXY|nr:unnamed protein product [Bursaphelenchus xylophilus]CAG9086921.1 unnamed protein product [Bursaphelenchus xylophilus]